ncbi:MAG TPA: hypothetical protein VLG50_03815 [Candidatus Saccharimonadales bacterium]|nr:hypothetical protein [Candidatus Saccharimonadales bacterium]
MKKLCLSLVFFANAYQNIDCSDKVDSFFQGANTVLALQNVGDALYHLHARRELISLAVDDVGYCFSDEFDWNILTRIDRNVWISLGMAGYHGILAFSNPQGKAAILTVGGCVVAKLAQYFAGEPLNFGADLFARKAVEVQNIAWDQQVRADQLDEQLVRKISDVTRLQSELRAQGATLATTQEKLRKKEKELVDLTELNNVNEKLIEQFLRPRWPQIEAEQLQGYRRVQPAQSNVIAQSTTDETNDDK